MKIDLYRLRGGYVAHLVLAALTRQAVKSIWAL